MKPQEHEPCSVTIRAAKKKKCEKNHDKARLLLISLLLPGVLKYKEKYPMNIAAAAMKIGIPSRPKPVFPTMNWNPLVILSNPEPKTMMNAVPERAYTNSVVYRT